MKVLRKQKNSRLCIVCGVNNEAGLKAPFYEMEDNTVVSIFEYKEHHQSYPNRVHGGLICAMLDEVIGRAIWIKDDSLWAVTIELNIKYRKAVPYNEKLKAIGKITKETSRTFEGYGEIRDMNNNLLVTANATYFKLKFNMITNDSEHKEDEMVLFKDDVKEIN